MSKPKTEEGKLKKDCEDYLIKLFDEGLVYYDRLNSGSLVATGGGYRRRIKLCRTGTYDFQMLYRGQLYFLELKAPGKKPSPDQRAFKEMAEKHGAVCVWYDSFDDFYAFLKSVIKEPMPIPFISRRSKASKYLDLPPMEGF